MICKQPPWILKSLRLQLSVPFPPEPLETAPATSYSWSMAIQVCPPNSKSSLQIWFSLSCPTSSIQYRFHDGIQWQIGSGPSFERERDRVRDKIRDTRYIKISYEDWEMTQGEPEDTSVLILLDCNHWFLLVDPEAWGDACCWLTKWKQHLTVLQKHIILHILP